MKRRVVKILLYILPVPAVVLSLCIGPSQIVPLGDVLNWIVKSLFHSGSPLSPEQILVQAIVVDVRLPRIILSFLVGGALTVAGAGLQAIFRNPLVSPYVLGLSSGAAFGAALAMATLFLPVQVSAFVFGILAVGMSYFLARREKTISIVTLILSGIIVTGVFTSLLTIIQFLSDPFKLQTIVHWTMGNLHHARWSKVRTAFIPILIGSAMLVLFRWRLNVLALGDEESRAVGVNPEREKFFILLFATLTASAAVSVAGVIGMVGLIVPHMVRMMLGPDYRESMPLHFLFGGSFLLLIDSASRTIMDFEIPIGVFTMLVGAPFFIFLLRQAKIGWKDS